MSEDPDYEVKEQFIGGLDEDLSSTKDGFMKIRRMNRIIMSQQSKAANQNSDKLSSSRKGRKKKRRKESRVYVRIQII